MGWGWVSQLQQTHPRAASSTIYVNKVLNRWVNWYDLYRQTILKLVKMDRFLWSATFFTYNFFSSFWFGTKFPVEHVFRLHKWEDASHQFFLILDMLFGKECTTWTFKVPFTLQQSYFGTRGDFYSYLTLGIFSSNLCSAIWRGCNRLIEMKLCTAAYRLDLLKNLIFQL